MLPDSPDVELVLEGPSGVFSALQRGSLIIDNSTIAPAVARRLAARAHDLGAAMIDAPVSGGEVGAINASLSIMIGGDEAAVARARPVLEAMGNAERIVHIGPSGAGQLCKVCNQMVIGGTLAAVSEAFALARKANVDPAKVRTVLLGGFASSRVSKRTANASCKRTTCPASAHGSSRKILASHLTRLPSSSRPRQSPLSYSNSSPR